METTDAFVFRLMEWNDNVSFWVFYIYSERLSNAVEVKVKILEYWNGVPWESFNLKLCTCQSVFKGVFFSYLSQPP